MTKQKPKYKNETEVTLKGEPRLVELACPLCKNTNLHQHKIEVFDREEDEEKGFHVTIGNKAVGLDENLKDNPSYRRQGLIIYFQCEHCDGLPEELKEVEYSSRLVIYQHKGSTFMHMESV